MTAKYICVQPYGWGKNGKPAYNIGDILEIKINEFGRITNIKDKTGKSWIFMGKEEVFHKRFISIAEHRDNQIESILNE